MVFQAIFKRFFSQLNWHPVVIIQIPAAGPRPILAGRYEAGGGGQAERRPGLRGQRLQRDGGPRPRTLRRLGKCSAVPSLISMRLSQ